MKKVSIILVLLIWILPVIIHAETNILTDGTASTDSQYSDSYSADKAVDDDATGTRWSTSFDSMPHWWKYDLGAGNAYAPFKLRICTYRDGNGGGQINNFKLQGSHNDSDWQDIYLGTASNAGAPDDGTIWQEFTFYAGVAYRYLRLYVIDAYGNRPDAGMWEIQIYGVVPYPPSGINPIIF